MTTPAATQDRAVPNRAQTGQRPRDEASGTTHGDQNWIQYRVSLVAVVVFVLMMAAIWIFADALVEVPWSM